MGKGTPSKSGGKKTHIVCRRCGRHSYHIRKKRCSYCGFGESKRMRKYSWAKEH
ncbi:50S ribosomal protein L37e [Euryarchaeota archaeon ex4484_162]|nr:50S ribosomal protein L37e [Thermoplasmata archaeon]OYT56803.1 MAG: 50S ribosomal protein L37e [Euryarchaeota archaeon ex4484_162]